MNNVIRGISYFVLLVLIQVLILNNIHFLRLVTPFLYLYFIVKMPVGFTSARVTFLSFLLGLIIDIFSNTPGMHAAACTFAGFARPAIIKVLMGDELPDAISPSFKTFGYGGFFRYVIILVVLHHFTLFIVESLTLFDPLFLLIRIVGNVTATTLLICIVEAFNVEGQRND
ncbi:MAG: rod shape-determining protein MreD [Tannerellaceae bacterium]|jgi:rod shape-determining protein MreD|nr:rod shape-determining protein MreD [Tannerellaceae bacterium]